MTALVSASVQTLTAEVRVLTVGNRQITAGVAGQLDRVPWHQMEPMGRVRLSSGSTYIGRDRDSGGLVLAMSGPPKPGTPVLNSDHILSMPLVGWCKCQDGRNAHDVTLKWDRGTLPRNFTVLTDEIKWQPKQADHNPYTRCDLGWSPLISDDLFIAAVDRAYRRTEEMEAECQAAAELPLIVLASMR